MANRLGEETSPYLLQHADNPVHWQAWGPEALAEAAERDVPVLVSIGYSACHWCHVMEHESFSDPAIAEKMNANFVCVKVDREEHPDVDAIFMDACQAITGQGGWPLNAFASADGSPFWAGTYFPPQPRGAMPSWTNVLDGIATAWVEERDQLQVSGERLAARLAGAVGIDPVDELPGAELTDKAVRTLGGNFDSENGGFGGAPKFPPTEVLEFLLAEGDTTMAIPTLHAMADGGIHDQIGGGFARYAVDATWTIPHFEKMLYDNAMLARAYLHGWQVSGDQRLLDVCKSTLDWMLRELAGPDGGLYAALDADDQEGEGRFYAWTPALVAEALPEPDDAAAACAAFGITPQGNYEDGLTVPIRADDHAQLDRFKSAMFETRSSRPRPKTDTKVIAAWNALAISALADAGAVLEETRYLTAAADCAEYLLTALAGPDGRVMRCLRGSGGVPGVLDDHALLLAALLDLYEATFNELWFQEACDLASTIWDWFGDTENGGYFMTASDGVETLAARRKEIEDQPVPSGASAMAVSLIRLHALTGDATHLDRADCVIRNLTTVADRAPNAVGRVLLAIGIRSRGVKEVAIAGEGREEMVAAFRSGLRRDAVIAAAAKPSNSLLPLLLGREPDHGPATAYVCRNFTCSLPVTSPQALLDQLNG